MVHCKHIKLLYIRSRTLTPSLPWHHSTTWPCLKIPGETNSTSLQTGSNWSAIERKRRFNPWRNRAAAGRAWREGRREHRYTPHKRRGGGQNDVFLLSVEPKTYNADTQGQMCPGQPSPHTKAVHQPEMIACVGVRVSHTPCLRKKLFTVGTAETCRLLKPSVAVKHVKFKKKKKKLWAFELVER